MELVVVGSSDAFNSAGRGHSCYWLEGGADRPLMVDFGGTALQGLQRLDLDPRGLGAVVLTHLHGDHFGGLPYLAVDLTYNRRRDEPMTLVGPYGTADRVERLLAVSYGPEVLGRSSFRFDYVELLPGDSVDVEGARVAAFAADHQDPPERPLCLRISGRDGAVVAFSGDTVPCAGLLAAAEGADLLVGDCTGCAPPAGRHVTWTEWEELLPQLEIPRVVLSHLGAAVRSQLPGELRARRRSSEVLVADDGLRLEIRPLPSRPDLGGAC